MNSFFKGVLVGVGIGLVVAPMRGEDMRRLLGERFQELRGYLPENEQMNQYMQQVSGRVSQASSNLGDIAQQAVSKVKDTSSSLSDLAQQATSTVKKTAKETAQDTTDMAKQSAGTAAQSGRGLSGMADKATGTTSTTATSTEAPFPSGYPTYTNPESR
jgi:gas vesicle protein